MPVINVKRFSRSKVDTPASPAEVVTPVAEEESGDERTPDAVSFENPTNDDEDDFADLTRSAFEASQREADATEIRAASEKVRAKEDAKIEKNWQRKWPIWRNVLRGNKRSPLHNRNGQPPPPHWMTVIVFLAKLAAKY